MYENIFNPIKIKDLEIKNRIVFAPTSLGYNRETYLKKLISIASGGTGLIIIGDVSVAGSFHRGIPTLSSDEHIDYYKKVCDEVHRFGCKISAQLFHPDYNIESIMELIKEQGSSREQIREMMKESMSTFVNEMSKETINNIKEKFVSAAIRAKKAGFDMIQIHGDRLLGSFSSSIFNNRTDEYGIDAKGRAKMSVDIVNKIRSEMKDMPIDYKLGIRKENPSLGKGGPTLEEVETFVTLLDEAGVDAYHVAIANHSLIKDTIPSSNHPYLKGEGCFLDLAKEVKKYTKNIVCSVGKFKTPEFIESVIENDVDMVALSRQLIADDKWPLKAQEGNESNINYCRFCNVKCTNSLMNGTAFGCILHDEDKGDL